MKNFLNDIRDLFPKKVAIILILSFGLGIILAVIEILFSVLFLKSFLPRFFTPMESLYIWIIFTVKLIATFSKVAIELWNKILSYEI